MCAFKLVDPLGKILIYDQKDKVCINLTHDIKVFFKLDDSIMVKNFNDNNCIAVAGVEELNKSRLFSLQKDGIKMHHNSTECLDIEIIDEHLMTFNNTYIARMQSRRGNCTINGTWTNSSHQLTDLTFNNHIKSCDEVFNQQTQEITEAMKARARMLINNCFYVKKPNGETVFKFLNGLEVIQLPNGHTEVSFFDKTGRIFMSPIGIVILNYSTSKIVSSNSHIQVTKGNSIFTFIDRTIIISQ